MDIELGEHGGNMAGDMEPRQRGSNGQFLTGHKVSVGNSGGKGGGTRDMGPKIRDILDRALSQDEQDALLQRLIARAEEEGGEHLARVLLDKMLPSKKPKAEPVVIEGLDTSSPISIASGVLAAIADGRVDPDSGQQLIKSVESLSNIITNESLAPQLEEMREQIGQLGNGRR